MLWLHLGDPMHVDIFAQDLPLVVPQQLINCTVDVLKPGDAGEQDEYIVLMVVVHRLDRRAQRQASTDLEQHRVAPLQRARDVRDQLAKLCERVEVTPSSCGAANLRPIKRALTAGFFPNAARLQRSGDGTWRAVARNAGNAPVAVALDNQGKVTETR